MRITAIIQARMGSTRLPGKSLADIHGKPLLERVIERTRASRRIGEIIVATTTEPADFELCRFAARCGAIWFRGGVDDVLDRTYRAAQRYHAEIIVRITADDPLKDPAVIDRVVDALLAGPGFDYASNTIEPTFPLGLDAEAFPFSTLERAWCEATDPYDREHVTPYIRRRPDLFRLASVRHSRDLSALRWTIDYPRDLEFARAVYARLDRGAVFGMAETLALLEAEPELALEAA
jgi:spore coat polysaccharide biosynthesis protein SpsF